MRIWFEAHAGVTTAKPLQRKLTSCSDVKAHRAVLKLKKKARQSADAPSNKTYGNCLLGLHCSHKVWPQNRAIA
jgi:hypothetical protein